MTAQPDTHAWRARGWPWRAPVASRELLVALLAFAAGSVDALSYLGLGHIFTANQTGNLVLLGLALGQGRSLDALRSLASVLGFLLGIVLASLIGVPLRRQAQRPTAVTRALALESALLLIFTLWGVSTNPNAQSAAILPYIVLAGSTMGMQNAILLALGTPGVTSTAITSTLTMLTGAFSARLHRRPQMNEQMSEQATGTIPGQTRLLATVLVTYLSAAVVTGVAERHWLLAAGALPTATVALVLAAALPRQANHEITSHE